MIKGNGKLVKNKGLKLFAAMLLIVMIPLGILTASFLNTASKDKIFDNVYINGTSVSGMSKSEAETMLKNDETYGNIDIRYNGNSNVYKLKDLGCESEVTEAVESAYNVGRTGQKLNDFWDYIDTKYLKEEKHFDVKNIVPQDIEEKIYNDIKSGIEKEPKDASISVSGSIAVIRGENGVKIDREKFKADIYGAIKPKTNIVVEVPVKSVEPKVKSEDLNKVNGVIGSYKTTFSSHVEGRNENIRVAAEYMNNTLLMPGEVFSYNEKTKLKTAKNGYKNATVIVNGEIEEGLGGGVCQVSSTLYNSVLYAGLEVVQRRPHSIPSNYVAYGRDAAVSDNSIDFKFKNNYDFPIFIKTYTGSSSVTVTIYGDTAKVPNIDITSSVVSKKVREVKYVDDETLPKGEEKVKTKGRDEVRSETYVIVNGEKRLVSKDKYPSQTKVILVGTKEKEDKETDKDKATTEDKKTA